MSPGTSTGMPPRPIFSRQNTPSFMQTDLMEKVEKFVSYLGASRTFRGLRKEVIFANNKSYFEVQEARALEGQAKAKTEVPEPEVKPEPVVNPPPHFEPNPWASMGPPEVDPWLGAKYPTGAGNVPVDTLDTSGSLTQTSKKKSRWSTDKKPTPEGDAWGSYRKEDHTSLQKAFPPSFFMDALRSEVDEESSE